MTTSHRSLRALIIIVLSCVAVRAASAQTDPTVRVTVSETINGGRAVYHYTVINNGERPITTLMVGFAHETGDFELPDVPLDWTIDDGIATGSFNSPTGWTPEVYALEDSDNVRIQWGSGLTDRSHDIAVAQTLGGFDVVLAGPADTYQSSHWTVVFDNGAADTGALERVPAEPAAGDITGAIAPGGPPVTLTFETPGQNARLTFDAVAGDRLSLLVTDVSIQNGSVFVLGPNGQSVADVLRVPAQATGFIDTVTMPTSGTYTIVIDPDGFSTGVVTLALYSVPPDVTRTLTSGHAETIALTVPGQNARLTFDGTAGQKVTLAFANNTIASANVKVLDPAGSEIGSVLLSSSNAVIDGLTLGSTGTYVVTIDPIGPDTGSVTITLLDATDITTSITAGGAPVTIQITTAGQNARLTFAGTAGQRVSLLMSDYTVSIFTEVSIVAPDGTAVSTGQLHSAQFFRDVMTLPLTGTYTIVVDPPSDSIGRITLTLYDVPADVQGSIAIGGAPVTVSIGVPGQNGLFTFDTSAGQQVTLLMSSVTINSGYVFIKSADGSTVARASISPSGGSIQDLTLTSAGTYSIVIDPSFSAIGSITLQLVGTSDVVGTIVAGGASVTVTLNTPGQRARLSFNGTAGRRISLQISAVDIAGSTVSIINPDATTLVPATWFGTSGIFVDARTLAFTGTYTILVDPDSTNTGSATLTLHDVPEDASGTVAVGGSTTLTVGTPGQNGRIEFPGTAGQQVTLRLTAVSIASAVVAMLAPDGSTLASRSINTSGGTLDNVALPATGTYSIMIDPTGASVGSMTLALADTGDVNATIVPGGAPVTVTVGTAGQNARVRFTAVAGQRISLQLTGVTIGASTCCTTRVSILTPSGSTLVPPTYVGTAGGFIDTQTLGTSGTYTILLDPDGTNIGSATLTLYDVPADAGSIIIAGGPPSTVTTTVPGQNARIAFSGTAGQRISLQVTGVTIGTSTCCGARVSILNPDGSALVSPIQMGTGGAFIDTRTLDTSGTYAIVVDPTGTNVGSATVQLYDVPSDAGGTIVPGGPPVTLTVATPGQNGRLTFDAAAGQRISLQVTGVTIGTSTCCGVRVSILNPDGSALVSPIQMGTGGAFIDTRTAPANGTYTITVDPDAANTGNAVLRLYDVPPDIDGTIAIGGTSTISIGTPGQNARAAFTGTAGQQVTLQLTAVSLANTTITIVAPDGSVLVSRAVTTSGASIENVVLASTGTYAIVVDPTSASTGAITLTLTDTADVNATIVAGGAPVTVTIAAGGQNARVRFTGAAGERVSLQLTGVTIGTSTCCSARVSIVSPAGTTLAGPVYIGTNGGFLDTVTLAAAGTYTILVDPDGANVGGATLTLYDVPPDTTAGIVPGGAAVTLTITVPGQNGLAMFSANAGQRVSVKISAVTVPGLTVSLLNPDASILASTYVGTSGGFIDVRTAATAGTYALRVDPGSTNTGSVTLTLYDVPNDPSLSITAGGSSVAVSTTTPGQNARLTFNGAAGERVSVQLTSVTIANSSIYLLKPDGSTLASTSVGTGGGFIDVRTLPSSGTYTILIDPSNMNTGSATVTLYEVAPDIAGPITPGGDPVIVTITSPGQNALISFTGTAGQRISLRLSSVTLGYTSVYLLNPNGSTLASSYVGSSGAFIDTKMLATTGTYTIRVDPSSTYTGNMTLTLYDVPPDAVASVEVNGPAAAMTIAVPGQNGSVTFAGTAGQQVTVRITGNTMGVVTAKLLRPDNSTLASAISSATNFNLTAQTLATSGVYTITIDPNGANTGGLNVNVTNP